MREEAMADAVSEMEFVASALAAEIGTASKGSEGAKRQSFERSFPGRIVARGRQVLITDRTGKIAGALPARSGRAELLSEIVADVSLLAPIAGAASIVRTTLLDGSEVLLTVRALPAPWERLVILQKTADILRDWRDTVWRIGSLLLAAMLVACGVTGAYLWQSARTREAQGTCDRLASRMDSALAHGRCGLWDWDIARGRIHWSASMYDMLGLIPNPAAISIRDASALVHPEDGDLAAMARDFIASGNDAIDHVFRMRNSSGEWLWIRARAEVDKSHSGSHAHLIGIALDITEQRKLEEKTRTADERLRAAVETISEAFVLWDENNRLVLYNSKFLRFHNLPLEAAHYGKHYDTVMSNATPPFVTAEYALSGTANGGARSYEAQLADGRWLQVNERRTADGGFVSVGTDITALKAHEEQLLDSERRLMATVADLRKSRQTLQSQAQQLSDLAEKYREQKAQAEHASHVKTAFLANMSHELRTPLNAIIGFSQMMEDEIFGALGSPRYVEYTSFIRHSGQALLAIISDVLDMSTLDAGQMRLQKTSIDLGECIVSAVNGVKEEARGKNIGIQCDLATNVFACADRTALEKVLLKLLRNAVKFTPESGRISVGLQLKDGEIDIVIQDTGIGISAEHLERVTRPFEQINSPIQNGMKGSGLGLAIAQSFIRLHGGILHIDSVVGSGTIVTIHLPLPAASAQAGDTISVPAAVSAVA
ncbi:MAG: PAS domain-containing sensor histidine kinase [Beijerinckiaceae bacterium]